MPAAGNLVWGLVGLGVLAQIAYPLVGGAARDTLTIGTVLMCCVAAVTHATVTRGARTAALVLLITAGSGLLVEAVGRATGWPFGAYDYAGSLGGKVLGVPLVIPLAWTMMAWPAWLVAGRLVRGAGGLVRGPFRVAGTGRPLRVVVAGWALRVVVAGWALASWDFFLDPQMVAAGHWSWSDPTPALPGVAGVPLTNYAGWIVVAIVMMTVLAAVLPTETAAATGQAATERTDLPMFVFYLWTFASSVLAHLVFFDLSGSALWGGLAMGVVALPLAATLGTRVHR